MFLWSSAQIIPTGKSLVYKNTKMLLLLNSRCVWLKYRLPLNVFSIHFNLCIKIKRSFLSPYSWLEDINYEKWEKIFAMHTESAQKSNFCKRRHKKSLWKSALTWQANLKITLFGFSKKLYKNNVLRVEVGVFLCIKLFIQTNIKTR